MYNFFAEVYDDLMYDVDYKKRTAYLMKLFKKYGNPPNLLLDAACGTGGFSCEFAKCGVEVIGVDMSEEMLSVAREKSMDEGRDILFLCQKLEELDLYGTVDGAVCCLDSLNHITDYTLFCRAIERVALFLEEERLFIFDVNTVYKHKTVLADNTFIIDQDGVYCVWQNITDKKSAVTDIILDFFISDGELYRRTGEEFSERAYTESEIENAVRLAGLKILDVLDGETGKAVSEYSERAVYVTQKVKET